jgi:predicted HTH domain antitoxin
MAITLSIPPSVEATMRKHYGPALEKESLELLAVEWYRHRKIDLNEFAEVLKVSPDEAQRILERHPDQQITAEEVREQADAILQALR